MGYFLLLSVLNLLDGVITYWGLTNGWISEANPIMRWVWYTDPFYFMTIKVFLSTALVVIGFYFDRFSYKLAWTYTMRTVNLLYGVVLGLHIYWLSALFT